MAAIISKRTYSHHHHLTFMSSSQFHDVLQMDAVSLTLLKFFFSPTFYLRSHLVLLSDVRTLVGIWHPSGAEVKFSNSNARGPSVSLFYGDFSHMWQQNARRRTKIIVRPSVSVQLFNYVKEEASRHMVVCCVL